MSTIEVNFDESQEELILFEVEGRIGRTPLIAAFLRKHGAFFDDEGAVRIPTTVSQLDGRYQSLKKIFDRYGLHLGEAAELSNAMVEVKSRENLFDAFSSKAAAIWRGNVDRAEFQSFLTAVEKECPKRGFYDKQLLAAYHLAFSQNACNFSVPGAGKTSVVYAAYAFLRALEEDDERRVDHLLIVGPLSSFRAWEHEFGCVFDRALKRQRVFGAIPAYRRKDYLRGAAVGSGDTEVTMTSYHTLYSSETDFRVFLQSSKRRVMMVLDEAHNIKREDGIWANSVLKLAPFARARVVLTGTPAPNGYEDLQNLFSFIYPERNIIKFHNSALIAMSEGTMNAAIPRLKENIRPFFVRIRKKDLNLPETEENVVSVELSKAQEEIYRSIEKLIVPRFIDDLENASSTLARARLIRLRQAATNPQLLLRPLEEEMGLGFGREGFSVSEIDIAERVAGFDPHSDLEKVQVLRTLVAELLTTERKILIWSVFLGNLELLRNELSGMAANVNVICGATPVEGDEELPEDVDIETRERIISRFLRNDETAILIANPQAVGESISLHEACHVAIYFDRDFNAGRFIQSKDRIHRFGLKPSDRTRYYYFVSEKTVDVDIQSRLLLKERRLSDLIDADDIPLFKLVLGDDEDAEDLRAIIRSYERRKAQ